MPSTFQENVVDSRLDRGYQGMTMEAADIFRDAMLGIKVMHDGGWVY